MRKSRSLSLRGQLYRALLTLSVAAALLGWYRPVSTLSGPIQVLGVLIGVGFLFPGVYYLLQTLLRAYDKNHISTLPTTLQRDVTYWIQKARQERGRWGRQTTESMSVQHLRRCEGCSMRNQRGVYRTTRDETLVAGVPVKVHSVELSCLCDYCDKWEREHGTVEEPAPNSVPPQ
jgi:hypothetical protein